MEDTLRDMNKDLISELSLNPCFNGRYSQSFSVTGYICKDADVLILVLMEDTLRANSNSDY